MKVPLLRIYRKPDRRDQRILYKDSHRKIINKKKKIHDSPVGLLSCPSLGSQINSEDFLLSEGLVQLHETKNQTWSQSTLYGSEKNGDLFALCLPL